MRSRPDGVAALAVALPAAVLAALAGAAVQGPWGDQAVIQLATDRAARFEQLLGPYSRFGWSHPGPLYFYLLALPYRALGGTQAALSAASVILAALFGVTTVLIVGGLAGRTAARWTAALVVAEMAALGAPVVAEVWNPVAIILPAGTFLVACAGLAVGRWWALVPVVAVGSFLVQTDVSTTLLVGVAALVALGLAGLGWLRGRARGPGWLMGSLALAGVLWLAPAYQQATGRTGNMAALLRFFGEAPAGHGLGQAVDSVAGALWPPLAGRLSTPPPTGPAAWAIVLGALGLAAAGAAAAAHRRRPVPAALSGAGLVAVLVGVVSAERVTGTIYSYLVEWLSATGLVILLGLFLSVIPPADRAHQGARLGGRKISAGAAGLAAAGLAALGLADRPTGPAPGATVQALWAQTRTALARAAPGPGSSVRLDLPVPGRWPWAAGLAVELEHAGYSVWVPGQWAFLFGHQMTQPPGARPRAVLTVQPASGPGPLATPGHLVASCAGTEVLLLTPSG